MEEKIIQLAALLHDVGMFWQSAGGGGGKHAELSGRFVQGHVPWDGVVDLISLHHDPTKYESGGYKPLKTIICADWLSSGERRDLSEENEQGEPKATPLMSIFSEIEIGKGQPASALYYPIKKLELDKDIIFPKPLEGRGGKDRLKSDYAGLWGDFVEEVDGIKGLTDFDAYFNTLYHLLQKYTWCMPSAVGIDVPDVSLFDHLKTTCAVAACLYNADVEYLDNLIGSIEKSWRKEDLNEEEERALNGGKFLLIGGDVSGIQNFIYAITSKGAAKGLRGRSFYLELLTESIAKYILRELNLPIANLLYCGGGHFYVLAPSGVEADLESLRKKIAEYLLEVHSGELYLVLDWLQVSANVFQKRRFDEAWTGIGKKIAIKKKIKFAEILDQHDKIFGHMSEGGTKEICDICGTEEKVKEEEGRKICNFCKSLERLAKDIGKANYWLETWNNDIRITEKEKGSWKEAICKFGMEYEFVNNLGNDIKRRDADQMFVYKLNDTHISDIILGYINAKSPISVGFKFLAKNTPLDQKEIKDVEGNVFTSEEIKDFSDFANDSEGIKNWAVLRADIDNLGKIFAKGLKEDTRTISRVSNLSSMLSLFFMGWMEKICENEEYKDNVYAIYSGGDDLFVVGTWNKMPELGKVIYDDFRVFTGSNPNMTLSAGIAIAPSKKYPLYQAADLAGEALDKSKGLDDKDGLTFLDIPMKWNIFSRDVIEFRAALKKLLAAGVSRGFLQKMCEIYDEYKKQKSKHGVTLAKYDDRYGRWRWLLAYVIVRTKVSKENKHLLEGSERHIRKNIVYLPIAVRWVDYLTRKE